MEKDLFDNAHGDLMSEEYNKAMNSDPGSKEHSQMVNNFCQLGDQVLRNQDLSEKYELEHRKLDILEEEKRREAENEKLRIETQAEIEKMKTETQAKKDKHDAIAGYAKVGVSLLAMGVFGVLSVMKTHYNMNFGNESGRDGQSCLDMIKMLMKM